MRHAIGKLALGKIIFSIAMLACAPLHAEPLTIKHTQGEVTLDAAPQNILVLDINALDIIDALGADLSVEIRFRRLCEDRLAVRAGL
jgi:ABC-type enterochelin transport system substrate-binding protein